jgi:hypothetical protein
MNDNWYSPPGYEVDPDALLRLDTDALKKVNQFFSDYPEGKLLMRPDYYRKLLDALSGLLTKYDDTPTMGHSDQDNWADGIER